MRWANKDSIGKGTPLTPTNREVRSVERPFLFKFISFQLYLNSCNIIYVIIIMHFNWIAYLIEYQYYWKANKIN